MNGEISSMLYKDGFVYALCNGGLYKTFVDHLGTLLVAEIISSGSERLSDIIEFNSKIYGSTTFGGG